MRRVFVSGCFDGIHAGHMAWLTFAAAQGDHLTVMVGTDESIRMLKHREPLFSQLDRMTVVRALKCVDAVRGAVEHGNDDCFGWIEANRPDVWVLYRDNANIEEKYALAAKLGISCVMDDRPKIDSTSRLIERLSGHGFDEERHRFATGNQKPCP